MQSFTFNHTSATQKAISLAFNPLNETKLKNGCQTPLSLADNVRVAHYAHTYAALFAASNNVLPAIGDLRVLNTLINTKLIAYHPENNTITPLTDLHTKAGSYHRASVSVSESGEIIISTAYATTQAAISDTTAQAQPIAQPAEIISEKPAKKTKAKAKA